MVDGRYLGHQQGTGHDPEATQAPAGYPPGLPELVSVIRHLLALRCVTVEDRSVVEQPVENAAAGFDFADALHHASYRACSSIASFDDRTFARRAKRMGLAPAVVIPS
jgi:hypothetical protein